MRSVISDCLKGFLVVAALFMGTFDVYMAKSPGIQKPPNILFIPMDDVGSIS